MNMQSLESALVGRGYLDCPTLQGIVARSGETPDRLLPALLNAGVLVEAEVLFYAYGCEEYEIEPILRDLLKEKKAPPAWLRDLFRNYISSEKQLQQSFEDFLVESRQFSEEEVCQMLARKFQIPFLSLRNTSLGADEFRLMPPELIQEFECVPLRTVDGVLHIALAKNIDRKVEIETTLGKKVVIHLAPRSQVKKVLSDWSRLLPRNSQAANGSEFDEVFLDDENLTAQRLADPSDSVVQLINQLMFNAIEEKASDIHFEPAENHIQVKFRIDGILFPIQTIDKKSHQALSGRIKIISELDTTQKRAPQDGRFKLRINGRGIDFRVSIIPRIFGESIVIRILDKLILDLELGHLGFSERDLALFEANILNPYGMILVAGPTGSGKTTTLYSAITRIASPQIEIVTIEDPVEYIIAGIIQIAVNDKQGLSFSNGLRSIVRHDPDIIMVGEIRDSETAQIAIQASLTGHLVFSTIHCNNTIDVISRFANMGIETYEFTSAVNLLMAQRLVRRLCPDCREADPNPDRKGLFRGRGCLSCKGRGYQGRTGIFEVLPMNETIKTMILNKASPFAILAEAKKQGLLTLRETGLEKVQQGMTTLDEVNAVTMDPQAFGRQPASFSKA